MIKSMDLFISSNLFSRVRERHEKKKKKKKIAVKYIRKRKSVYELISKNASTVNETLIAKVISLRTGNAFTSNILKGRKIVIRYAISSFLRRISIIRANRCDLFG